MNTRSGAKYVGLFLAAYRYDDTVACFESKNEDTEAEVAGGASDEDEGANSLNGAIAWLDRRYTVL